MPKNLVKTSFKLRDLQALENTKAPNAGEVLSTEATLVPARVWTGVFLKMTLLVRRIRLMLTLLALLSLTACGATVISYRLTFEFEVDGTLRVGSGVLKSLWYDQSALGGLANGAPWAVHVNGEAVAIDLGPAGFVFALLTGPLEKDRGSGKEYFSKDAIEIFLKEFGGKSAGSINRQDLAKISERRESIDLRIANLPMFVTFRDINDPLSVERMDPRSARPVIGHSVIFRRAAVEITNAPPTTGIDTILPWLAGLHGGYLDGGGTSSNAPLGLSAAEFKLSIQ